MNDLRRNYPNLTGCFAVVALCSCALMFCGWSLRGCGSGSDTAALPAPPRSAATRPQSASPAPAPTKPRGRREITSDAKWKYSASHSVGWQNPEFDDGNWRQSTIVPDKCIYAHWAPTMWAPTHESADTVYFRKTFRIPYEPDRASLDIGLDDMGDVHINGNRVWDDNNDRATGKATTDVSAYLHQGQNVIAVRAVDVHCCCRAVVLRLEY